MIGRLEVVLTALSLAAAGFVLGRLSGGVNDHDLRDSLAVYRSERSSRLHVEDSLQRVIGESASRLTEVEMDRNRLAGVVRVLEGRAAAHRSRADSLLALLATARTSRDSNAILVPACTERGLECAAIRSANDSLHAAAEADSAAKAELRRQLAARVEMRRLDSLELERTGRLIPRLERAARGCHLPLVGLPCPAADVKYNLTQRAFDVGGSLPLKAWLRVGITTQIGGKTP